MTPLQTCPEHGVALAIAGEYRLKLARLEEVDPMARFHSAATLSAARRKRRSAKGSKPSGAWVG